MTQRASEVCVAQRVRSGRWLWLALLVQACQVPTAGGPHPEPPIIIGPGDGEAPRSDAGVPSGSAGTGGTGATGGGGGVGGRDGRPDCDADAGVDFDAGIDPSCVDAGAEDDDSGALR